MTEGRTLREDALEGLEASLEQMLLESSLSASATPQL